VDFQIKFFGVYINYFKRTEINKSKVLHLRNNKYINKILFAGDKVLVANTEGHLRNNITKLNTIPKLYDRKISTKKLKLCQWKGNV
jgi:hypothetical protein